MCHCTMQDDGCEYERKRNDEFEIWGWKDWIEHSGNRTRLENIDYSVEKFLLWSIAYKTNK